MMTRYTLLRKRCGLSQPEAATFHDVRVREIREWDKDGGPPGPLHELRQLYRDIEEAAQATLDKIDARIAAGEAPVRITIGLASDDAEAQTLGLPSVSAHGAIIGIIIALSPVEIEVVPRGSETGSAAAADLTDAARDAREDDYR